MHITYSFKNEVKIKAKITGFFRHIPKNNDFEDV